MRLISRGYSGPTKTSLYLYTQLILIAILFGFSQLMAQQENDSLHNILFGDTMLSQHERLSLTLNLAELFTTKTPDKAMSYCQAVLSFSDNLDQQDPELFLRANKLLASLQNRLCLYAKADSTYKVIETTFSENTDLKQLANHNFLMGQNYYDWSLYKLAMERYEIALQAYENIKDKEGSAACLQGLGSVVANWADYEQALGYLQRARDIYQRLENYKGLAAITLSLGVVMEHWGKYDRALDYYTQSLRYFKINNEKRQQINLHLHIGDIYLKQKSPQLALQQYNHAKKLEKASPHKKLKSIVLSNIGEAYFLLGRYDSALYFQHRALTLKKEVGDKKRLAISMVTIAKIYHEQGELILADSMVKQGLQISREINYKEMELEALKLLSINCEKQKDFYKAYTHLQEYLSLKDVIFTQGSQNLINELEIKYESQKKEKENENLRQRNNINKLQLEKERNTRMFTIIFATFLVLIAFIIVFFINSKRLDSRRSFSILAIKNKEITAQKEKLSSLNKALVKSREQYKSIVENATIGMYQTAPDGRIIFCNNAIMDMLRYPSMDHIKDVNLNERRAEFLTLINKQNIITGREDVWKRFDDTVMHVKESAWTIRDASGELQYYEGIVEDISKEKLAEMNLISYQKKLKKINKELTDKNIEFEKARQEAVNANQAKTQFLANISHEIRTPLNSIIGFTELIIKQIKDKTIRSHVSAIKSSGQSLLTLINDILDISRIQAGELELVYEPIALAPILSEVRHVFSIDLQEKGLDFHIEIAEDFPPQIFMDSLRFRQILFNLIGNSIKFTKEGEITLKVDVKEHDNEEDLIDLNISVEDSGIGISKEDQALVFEAFKQSSTSNEMEQPGTGLGLSITKRLVEIMGGQILLESEVNKGSRFSISLPNIRKTYKKNTDSDIKSGHEKKALEYLNKTHPQNKENRNNINFQLQPYEPMIQPIFQERFFELWQQLQEKHLVNDIVTFTDSLLEFVKDHQHAELEEYANELLYAAHNFEIEEIEMLLPKLSKMFE